MKAIAFTPMSLFRLSEFSIEEKWFQHFGLPNDSKGLKRVEVQEIVYILEESLDDPETPLIVVKCDGEYPVFDLSLKNVATLDRIIVVARSLFTNSVKIPHNWRPYHGENNRLSIYAAGKVAGQGARIYFDQRPNETVDLFAYARTSESIYFDKIPDASATHIDVRLNLEGAILSSPPDHVGDDGDRSGIVLSARLPQGFVQGASLEQWYSSKLTKEQRSFVDKPYDGPVRLRGTAGTGKTISLVVKMLRDAQQFESQHKEVRLGFLTHSLTSVDTISAIAESLDTKGLVLGYGKSAKIEIRTLYDLAHEHLRFELDKLSPLSLDGREGKRLQFEIIEGVLLDMARDKVTSARFSDISEPLKARWKVRDNSADASLVVDIMNEFASILDADGIRYGEERAEHYVKSSAPRSVLLLSLPKESDRRFILEVHRRYRDELRAMNTLSVDQMIADFSAFLESNRWDRLRDREGYDALFVDELHLFNAIERQLLHKLIKRTVETDGRPIRPPVFMAYDLKQSPSDVFIRHAGEGSIFNSTPELQNSDLVKLEHVFRYTPQIAEFLTDLDASFPAIDIPGEWGAYTGQAQLSDGSIPDLVVFRDDLALFKSVFDQATRTARQSGGRRVAVLCMNPEKFDRYVEIAGGQYDGKFLVIDSREPSSELRHAGKRFILSMPEYVAGLQFETVLLIHIDSSDAPADAPIGIRRRFISSVYLGASRAEKFLHLRASAEHGGASDVLKMALSRRSLIEVAQPTKPPRQ